VAPPNLHHPPPPPTLAPKRSKNKKKYSKMEKGMGKAWRKMKNDKKIK